VCACVRAGVGVRAAILGTVLMGNGHFWNDPSGNSHSVNNPHGMIPNN